MNEGARDSHSTALTMLDPLNALSTTLDNGLYMISKVRAGAISPPKYHIHEELLNRVGRNDESWQPIFHITYHFTHSLADTASSAAVQPTRIVQNSSANSTLTVTRYYKKIEKQLRALEEASDDARVVEVGAVLSAKKIVATLQQRNFPPPAVTWHGGDAIVMLWSLADTSYAITITGGELGYVIRRDRKLITMVDSIPIDVYLTSEQAQR